MKETTNRYEYNRVRKEFIGVCTFCGHHRGCNSMNKRYGKFSSKSSMTYPNWKLVSKNKKQWEEKPLVLKETVRIDREYVEILF